MIYSRQSGFTAVELLITLFVAAAFLVAGYQLYNVIIKDGGQTRGESRASNVAYDYLRRYTTSASNPCAASTPLVDQAITVAGISNVKVSITVSCPYTNKTDVSKVEALVKYNTPQQTVKYATYVVGSGGVIDPLVPTGLVGWWKLNGDANDSSGNGYNGTVTGATLTTGQNGQSNSAYSFNGSSNYITLPPDTILKPTASLTISLWIKPNAASSASRQNLIANQEAGGYVMRLEQSTTAVCGSHIFAVVYAGGSYQGTCDVGVQHDNSNWYHTAMVFDGSSLKVYVNSNTTSNPITGNLTFGPTTTPTCIASESTSTACNGGDYFNGYIDDVRIYNRALSSLEISTLYAEGAQ